MQALVRTSAAAVCRSLLLAIAVALIATATTAAQTTVMTPNGPVVVQGGAMRGSMRAVQPQPNQQSGNENKDKEKKEDDKEESKDKDADKDEGDEEKKAASGPVKRPDKPPRVPDPAEFDVKPVAGRVQFSFTGQPWPDVMQWLAGAMGKSLDWQELPGGYLNLTTQRPHTLAETRDLINARLQARGYALLDSGEVLSVAKIDKLDPSQIPRVSEDELYDRQPHDIVKVTFELPPELEPAKAVEDVKQALSPNAKALPLSATRRLLLIDTVANLRMVSALLGEERIEREGREIPRRFILRYARAEKVINTLYVVLGLDPASRPSQMELQIQQQKMQLLMQMQGAGKDVAKLLNKDGPPVYLAFNRHENSILANAPDREMKIIERTVEYLDIPARGSANASTEAADEARFAKTYRLEEIDPRSLVSTLEEIADLDPLTEIRGDSKADLLFVRGTEADHKKVSEMIAQLDRSGEVFEVFYLRRGLPADAVAGSIMALLGEEEKDDDSNNYRRYYYFYDQQDEEEEELELRVDADVEGNRLLVRGSQETIEQVRRLLEKMDALGARSAGERPMVLTDPIDARTTEELLEKLRRVWPTLGGGAELIIEEGAAASPAETPPAEPTSTTETPAKSAAARGARFRLLADAGATKTDSAAKPAVSITVTPDGRLLLGGNNAEAVARLERLVDSLAPPPQLFREFTVRHASAYYIHWKLEDYFEEELGQGDGAMMRDWWGDWRRTEQADKAARLSRRRKLRLIYNKQTNSIVAANASPQQLQTIERLIETWDKPPRTDLIVARKTGMIKVRYSKAKVIATALKEVYRDLLSSRDKEFDTEEEKGSGFALPRATEIEFTNGGVGTLAAGGKTKPIDVGFDGALSIGVDEISNMLVISAEKELYDSVALLAQTLDEQAKPTTTIRVMRVGVSAAPLQRALDETLGTSWIGGKPDIPPQVQQPEDQQQQQQGRPDRRRGDGRRRDRR